ncbi:MAG: methyltransferase, partial [Dongiaceae bacterium]
AALLKRLAGGDRFERARLAELIAGNLKTHICYVVRAGRGNDAVARIGDAQIVPVLKADAGLSSDLKPGGAMTLRIDGSEVRFALPRRAGPMLALIDGTRTLAQIHAALNDAEGGRLGWDAFKDEFDRLFAVLNGANKLFLQQAAVTPL